MTIDNNPFKGPVIAELDEQMDELAKAQEAATKAEAAEQIFALTERATAAEERATAETARADAAEKRMTDHMLEVAPAGHPVEPTDPDPEPGLPPFLKRGHILKQGTFTPAQRRAGVAVVSGLSSRLTLADVAKTPTLWDSEFGLAEDDGFRYLAGRPVTGWKMPRAEMGRTLTVGSSAQSGQGQPFPAPFETNGQPNMVFIDALEIRMRAMCDALLEHMDPNDRPIAHWPAFGQQWAEYYHGPEVRAAAGYSKDNVVRAHNAIATRARAVQDDYPTIVMGFQLSGHGPIADMIDDWARHIGEIFEPDTAMIHANGWAYRGQWGQQNADVDEEMDEAFVIAAEQLPGVEGFDNVTAGLQAIQDWGGSAAYPAYNDGQIRELFGQLRAAWADSWELYPAIFGTQQAATLRTENDRWLTEPRG